jgi:predicted metalloprotease
MIERGEKARSWMKEIGSDAGTARKRAKMIAIVRSVVVQTAKNAERNVERRMNLLESLINAVRGVKTRLVKKGTKDVRDVETNPATRRMRDETSAVASVSTMEAKFAVPRARQLCLQQLSILSSIRFQMMLSRLQRQSPPRGAPKQPLKYTMLLSSVNQTSAVLHQ